MTESDLRLSLIYTDAFVNKREWTADDHLAGLRAVFAAGADAQRRKSLSVVGGTEQDGEK